MTRCQTIRSDVATLARRLVATAETSLAADPVALCGEVLDCWQRGDQWEITLLDIKEDDASIAARLPASAPRPIVGRTVGLVGRYTVHLDLVDLTLRLVFSATHHDPGWVPQEAPRARERRKAIGALRKEYPVAAKLNCEPTRVALVTSPWSSAASDFSNGLLDERESVSVTQVAAPLEDGTVADIARSIRHAATLDVDLIVIARGGGRQVMLQRFSQPEVLRAVAEVASRLPVVVAIGHDRDHVDAEQFAWCRVSTPSAAAALVARELRIRRAQQRRRDEEARAAVADVDQLYATGTTARTESRRRFVAWRPRHRSSGVRGLLLLAVLAAAAFFGWSTIESRRQALSDHRARPEHSESGAQAKGHSLAGAREGGSTVQRRHAIPRPSAE